MKNIKHILSSVLVLILVLTSASAITAFAADDAPTLIFSDAEVNAGEVAYLELSLENPAEIGIYAINVNIKYDKTALTLATRKATTKDPVGQKNLSEFFTDFTNGISPLWMGEEEDIVDSDTLGSFAFTVAEDATPGNYEVEIVVLCVNNLDEEDVDVTTVPGTITVKAAEPTTATVTTSAAAGGTVTGAGEYDLGAEATVTATPDAGYKFAGWYANDALLSSDAAYTFTVAENVDLTAKFEAITYDVTVDATAGGTASGNGTYAYGADVTVTATPEFGYKFAGWFNGETLVSSDATYTFEVTENVTLTAKFEKITYSVAVDGVNGNTLNPYFVNGNIWTETDGTIKPAEGPIENFLLFDNALTVNRVEATFNLTLNGDKDTRNGIVFALTDNDNDNTFNWDAADVSYYWVCISGQEGRIQVLKMGEYEGWSMISAGGWTKFGTPIAELGIDVADGVTLAAEWDNAGHIKVFANGMLVEEITDPGTPLTGNLYGLLMRDWSNSADGGYSLDYNVSSFVAGGALATPDNEVSVTVDPTDAGTFTGTGNYYLGQNVTLTATPNEGYNFVGWYENGELVHADATYTFRATADRNLTAKFAKVTYTITVTPTEGGTVTGGGEYEDGASATLKATADEGYKFLGWYINDELVYDAEIAIHIVEGDCEIVAKFVALEYYNVTVGATEGGNASGNSTVLAGNTATVIATPNAEYKFLGWYVNGEVVSTETTYTFTPAADIELEARFEKKPVPVTGLDVVVESESGETVTGVTVSTDKAGYQMGEEFTVTVDVTGSGYLFIGWYQDGILRSADLSYNEVYFEGIALTAKVVKKPENNGFAYIFGYTDTEMGAEGTLLRGEAAQIIYRLFAQAGNATFGDGFDDMDGWYQNGLLYVSSTGLWSNTTSAYPYAVVKGEVYKIICLGYGLTTDGTLSDGEYAQILKNAGYIDEIDLDGAILRWEFCEIINKITGRDQWVLEDAEGNEITAEDYGFTDLDDLDESIRKTMLIATSNFANGYVDLAGRANRDELDKTKKDE